MPTKPKAKRRSTGPNTNKRHATHHRVSKHYLKVYWPYVPMLLIVGLGLFLGTPKQNINHGVLAYATEMSGSQLLAATNDKRVDAGKQTLKINQQLTQAAQVKAHDMVSRDYWSHYTPDGKAPWVFIDNVGYGYTKAGENLAYGFATSDDTIAGWMNSQTHKDNMLDPAFSEVGFGFANASSYNNSGKETIVVAMYGQPKTASNSVLPSTTSPAADGPYSTSFASGQEPATKSISLLQKLTGGNAPWATFAFGLLSGALLLFMVVRHGLAFKRVLIHGEQFFLKHPAIDLLVVSFVMIGYVLGQTNGFIRQLVELNII